MLRQVASFEDRLAQRIARTPLIVSEATNLDELARFRYRVYIEQSGKNAEHADHQARTLIEPLDATSTNLIARDAMGRLVGSVRISRASDGWSLPPQCAPDPWPWIPPEKVACVTRLMVDQTIAPLATMPTLFASCYRWGLGSAIWLSVVFCAPDLRSVFLKYGCIQFDEEFLDIHAGTQIPMCIVLNDFKLLADVSSPFVSQYIKFNNGASD